MLANIRVLAKSPFAAVLFGLLVASFAVFGISDIFKNPIVKDAVVQAGSRSLSSADFKQAFDANRKRYEQQSGQAITTEQAVAMGFEKQLASTLADGQAFAELLSRMKLRPSDKLIVNEIRKAPTFFDPITGKFDKKSYDSWLMQQGITAQVLETEFRDGIAENHFFTGVMAGLQAPRLYGAVAATFVREGRTFSWFQLSPAVVGPPPVPTDAELNAYIKANTQRFTKPEMRQLSVVRFSVQEIASTMTANPADVQKRFDFEKDALSTPEKRSVVQIPIKDKAKAADAVARLRKGDDPTAVAKSLGVQPAIYTDSPKTAIADRKVADAAFALTEGEVAGPVDGALGVAVIKVVKIIPGKAATLEEARKRIEGEILKNAATEKVYDQVQKYQDTRAAGAAMAEAAKKLNLQIITLPPIDAQGRDPLTRQLNLPAKALEAAFTLPAGGETDMDEVAPGEYFAIRVDKVAPSAPVTLAEARPAILQTYMQETGLKRYQAKAEELAGRIRKGESLEAVAASVRSPLRKTADMRRDGNGLPFSREFVGSLFGAKKGETVAVLDQGAPDAGRQGLGYIIAKIDEISVGAPAEIARTVDAQRAPLSQTIMRDVADQVRVAARDEIKPRVDEKRARSALGIDPATAPAPTAPAKP